LGTGFLEIRFSALSVDVVSGRGCEIAGTGVESGVGGTNDEVEVVTVDVYGIGGSGWDSVVETGGFGIADTFEGDIALILGTRSEADFEVVVLFGLVSTCDTGRGGSGGLGFDIGSEYGGGISVPTVNPEDCSDCPLSLRLNA
jgi:hypothetical protein